MRRDSLRRRALWILPIWNTDRPMSSCVTEAEAMAEDIIPIRAETVALFVIFVLRSCVWTSAAAVVEEW